MPEGEDVTPDEVISSGHGVEAFDKEAWKKKKKKKTCTVIC